MIARYDRALQLQRGRARIQLEESYELPMKKPQLRKLMSGQEFGKYVSILAGGGLFPEGLMQYWDSRLSLRDPSLPVTGVSYAEAQAVSFLAGGRLCTFKETLESWVRIPEPTVNVRLQTRWPDSVEDWSHEEACLAVDRYLSEHENPEDMAYLPGLLEWQFSPTVAENLMPLRYSNSSSKPTYVHQLAICCTEINTQYVELEPVFFQEVVTTYVGNPDRVANMCLRKPT